MDSKTIETLSVSAVRDSIDVCDYLQQYIDSNDKSPSWDGYVNIYDGTDKAKAHMKGRMPVQVKGKECADHSSDVISFSADVSDLRNYLYDGGAMYFVVLIHPSTYARKIYFSELTPIKLRVLLEGLKDNQKTKSIELKAFPEDNNLKANIFLSCRSDCDKQASFKTAELLSLEELEKSGLLESLTFSVYPIGFKDYKEAVLASEVYMYAKIKGYAIPQPIEAIPSYVSMVEEIKKPVSVDGRKFYDSYHLIKSQGKQTVKIGDSLQITFSQGTQQFNINYKNPDSVRLTARDIEFMLAVLEAGHLEIGNTTVPFDVKAEDKERFGIDRAREKMIVFQKICLALDLLGCSGDLVPSTMKDQDWRNADILVKAFVEKQPVQNLRENLDFINVMTVGGFKFLLVFEKHEDDPRTYTIWDFFRTDLNIAYQDEQGEFQRISQYSILKAEDYLSLTNVRYNVIMPSFLMFRDNAYNMDRLNWQLLELIKAYDYDPRPELKDIMETISEWLLENLDDQELPYEVRLLNRLQVIKRQRDLTQSEMKKLNDIAQTPGERDDVLAGTYLLMGNTVLADVYLEKLGDNQKNEFLQYPIYKFHG